MSKKGNKLKPSGNYNYRSLYNNIHFLQRIKDCIERRVNPDVIEATLVHLDMLIKNEKEKIKSKPNNGTSKPRIISL